VHNLAAFDGGTCVITITAPGAVDLPWDTQACGHRLDGSECSGKIGCRVDAEAARRFNEGAMKGWATGEVDAEGELLLDADGNPVREGGWSSLWESVRVTLYEKFGPGRSPLLAYVPELQERGVVHLHLILGARDPVGRIVVRAAGKLLQSRAHRHGWGFVDAKPARKLRSGGAAAAYASKYLAPTSGGKPGVSELVMSRQAPTRVVYVTNRLSASTRCTMRNLRSRRYLFMVTGETFELADVEAQVLRVRFIALMRTYLQARADEQLDAEGLRTHWARPVPARAPARFRSVQHRLF
jgi:hypothetical protein